MNTAEHSVRSAAERYIDAVAAQQGDWLATRRRAAAARIEQLGFPVRGQERWRYTNVDGLLDAGFQPLERPGAAVSANEIARLQLGMPKAGLLVFVDGVFRPELSSLPLQGVSVTSLRAAMAVADLPVLESLGALAGEGGSAFSALNLAAMQDGAVIRVPAGSSVDEPIELLHLATGAADGAILSPRHLVMLEEASSITLVERFLALTGEPYFTNTVCEIDLGPGSALGHYRLQQEAAQAYHLGELHLRLDAEARYRGVTASMGSRWSRTEINGGFSGAGAGLEMQGLYLAGDGQLVDYHLDIDHGVPGCNSEVNFKGIAYGRGRAVFDGRILVQRQAQKSNAHLANANLMLSRRSEIDTKPQLEILADDVQCSHGTTVGQLDPQAIYYLRSRGLGVEQARRMLCMGFVNEILDQVEYGDLRDRLDTEIRRRLESTGEDRV